LSVGGDEGRYKGSSCTEDKQNDQRGRRRRRDDKKGEVKAGDTMVGSVVPLITSSSPHSHPLHRGREIAREEGGLFYLCTYLTLNRQGLRVSVIRSVSHLSHLNGLQTAVAL